MTLSLITEAELTALYAPLFAIGLAGKTREEGFTRLSWSQEEDDAMAYIQREAEKIGLVARFDSVGNLALEQPGFQEYVETGSHVDTVIRGGNYDGAGGVVCGLAAIRAILAAKTPLKRGLRLRIWRGEESTAYHVGCKGSRIAFGALDPATLKFTTKGKTLADAITERGFSPAVVAEGGRTVSQAEIDGIAAHIELHIEQANALEQQRIDIGVVTSIRGPYRFRASIEGRFDHSGGTPLGTNFRKDANLALAYMMVAVDDLGKQALAKGKDLVQTVGIINSDQSVNERDPRVYQNATAKVSGFAYCTFDIRSSDLAFRTAHLEAVKRTLETVAREYGVTLQIEHLSESNPLASLDPGIQAATTAAAKKLNISSMPMPSGAMHDCAYIGEQRKTDGTQVPIGMIFIPCREGISHAPDEYASDEALTKGANVLAEALWSLAS